MAEVIVAAGARDRDLRAQRANEVWRARRQATVVADLHDAQARLRDAFDREALVSFDPSSVKIAPVCNPTDRSYR